MIPIIEIFEHGQQMPRRGGRNFEILGLYVGGRAIHNYTAAVHSIPIHRPVEPTAVSVDADVDPVPVRLNYFKVRSILLHDKHGAPYRWAWEMMEAPDDVWETPYMRKAE